MLIKLCIAKKNIKLVVIPQLYYWPPSLSRRIDNKRHELLSKTNRPWSELKHSISRDETATVTHMTAIFVEVRLEMICS
jgi:hypothetical protein